MDDQIHCNDQFASVETTCALLLLELQKIWDQVGESDDQRDKTVFEIEQECVQVYRRKVDEAKTRRSELQQAIAMAEMEIESIASELREQPGKHGRIKISLNLKEELEDITQRVEETRKRRADRKKQFVEVLEELQEISNEIFGSAEGNMYQKVVAEGADLSMKKLEELQEQLQELRSKKSDRLKQVLGLVNTLKSLCAVLGMDYKCKMHEIHPTLHDSEGVKCITDSIIKKLATMIRCLQDVKIKRMQRLQDLATGLLELWNLMDTPVEEQQMFQSVTSNIAASEVEITEPNMLSLDFINHVEKEMSRLEQLKASKVKELVLKKRLELEEISRKAHMATEALAVEKYSIEATCEAMDSVHLLEEIKLDIARAKEEAFNRKEIVEKVEKWLAACKEESWLEEYNRDEYRYSAGRGAHLNLKRAEKARILADKIPAIVEALTSKITAWEKKRGIQFLYDGERLFSRLEEYKNLRLEKEKEKLRQRDQKRLQGQQIAEQKAIFGLKSSPSKSGKKAPRPSIGVACNRKLSLGGAMLQNMKAEKPYPLMHLKKKRECLNQNSSSSQRYSGFASQSSGWRNSVIPGQLGKQHGTPAKTSETESLLIRKPLSPVFTVSSKANITNYLEDQTTIQNGRLQTSLPCVKAPIETHSKYISFGDVENINPKILPIPVPRTPPTLSAPMLMALTPATPYVPSSAKTVKKVLLEQVEYSFEEVRAGFICPEP